MGLKESVLGGLKPEEKEVEEEKPAVVVPVQSYADFLQRNFVSLVLSLVGLFVAAFVFKIIELNIFAVGLILVFAIFVIVPGFAFFNKRGLRATEIEPLNPLKEKLRFEQEFREAGMDIKVLEAIAEPYEGVGSDQPYTTHFLAEQQFADGSRKPFIFRAGNLTRIPIGWQVGKRYLENRSYSSAGTRKRPNEVVDVPRPIQTSPVKVQVVIPKGNVKVNGKEDTEEEVEE